MGSIPGIVSGILMTVYYSVIIPFLIFFFLKDGRDILRRFINYVPNAWFEMVVSMFHQIDTGIGRFLRGIFIENSIIAVLAISGLSIIGMPSAFFVGLLVGLFNVIPYMGPTIGLIISAIMTLVEPGANPPLLAVLAVIGCVQLIDNMLVYPLAIGKSVHMHPVNVIGALLVGGFFLGFFGMLLAVPLATTIIVIYKTFIRAWRDYRPRVV
jgi:predicted PurR-regulated permease PerM